MTGNELRTARKRRQWTQQQAAARLRVSQPYLSLMERDQRPVPMDVVRKLAKYGDVPATALPLEERPMFDPDQVAASLGALGYPAYAYRSTGRPDNPAALLLSALRQDELEPRLTEALPWLLLHYPDLNWEWLVEQTKRHNLQNRLGFLTTLARELAEKRKDSVATHTLRRWECVLDDARLAKTDTLARRLTTAERKFFTDHRSPAATHWNLLTSLQASDLGDEAT